MGKTILVPTDFSLIASNAASYAAAFAKEIHARVLLLHTFYAPMFSKDKAGVITDPAATAHEHEERLKKEAARLVAAYGVDVKYRLKTGFLVDEIIEAEKDASFVVMGLCGEGCQGKTNPGSMVTATIAKTTKPLLVIPEHATFKRPAKIVFACDFDPGMDVNALNALKSVVQKFESTVYVVNVKHEFETVESNTPRHKKVEKKLSGIPHIYSFPHNENKAEALNEFVEGHHADMIAMIPHHYNLFDSMFHQRFTKKMAFYSHVPVLTLPEHFSSLPGYIL